jgi:hypothetical protein
MKEAAGAFPGRNELWGGRLLWLRERQRLVRQEYLLQLAKQTGRTQCESQSTRGCTPRGSAVPVIGSLPSIPVELREADKNPSCGPILRRPAKHPLVKPALLRCSVCKRSQTGTPHRSRLPLDETLPTWHGWCSLPRGVGAAVADLSDSLAAKASYAIPASVQLSVTTAGMCPKARPSR